MDIRAASGVRLESSGERGCANQLAHELRQLFGVSWGNASTRRMLGAVLHLLGTGVFSALVALRFFW